MKNHHYSWWSSHCSPWNHHEISYVTFKNHRKNHHEFHHFSPPDDSPDVNHSSQVPEIPETPAAWRPSSEPMPFVDAQSLRTAPDAEDVAWPGWRTVDPWKPWRGGGEKHNGKKHGEIQKHWIFLLALSVFNQQEWVVFHSFSWCNDEILWIIVKVDHQMIILDFFGDMWLFNPNVGKPIRIDQWSFQQKIGKHIIPAKKTCRRLKFGCDVLKLLVDLVVGSSFANNHGVFFFFCENMWEHESWTDNVHPSPSVLVLCYG